MRQRIVVVAALLVLATGCLLKEKTAYTVLNGIATAVYAGMQSYGALVKADVVPVTTQIKVKNAYESYQTVMVPAIMLAQAGVIKATSPEVEKVKVAGEKLMAELTFSGCANCVMPKD